jgi:DNA adenine methylase
VTKGFVKAVGGKAKLVPTIMKHVPEFDGLYHEPFVGGGAVFMALHEERPVISGTPWAVLNDSNAELMNAYKMVRSQPAEVIRQLQSIKHSEKTYYAIREKEEKTTLAKAIRFLYLNKTCFNGIYRVNGAGKFNVPVGKKTDGSLYTTIVEPEVVSVWSRALKGAELYSEDFVYRLGEVKKNDFCYCDPPYLPRSKTANFTSYTANKFGEKDHERLARALANVHKRGSRFLCSQGDSEMIRSLYKAFEIIPVIVRHSVSAAASSRTNVAELLIKNYD